MKSKIKQIFNLIFFILITNTHFLEAHYLFNGRCKNNCNEQVKPITMDKESNNISDDNLIEDNYSCLSKSLCRG